MLTTEKCYITELTMKECLDEYKALSEKLRELSIVYISIPKASSLKAEYYEQLNELHDEETRFAKEIADRLTS